MNVEIAEVHEAVPIAQARLYLVLVAARDNDFADAAAAAAGAAATDTFMNWLCHLIALTSCRKLSGGIGGGASTVLMLSPVSQVHIAA